LARELSLQDKKKAICVLLDKLNVRKITLSGGEPTIIGGVVLTQFLDLMEFIKEYKKKIPNLRIELLTNSILLETEVLEKIVGAVDRITITLDTINPDVLRKIGRSTNKYPNYLDRFEKRMIDIQKFGFETKIHSVVTPVNFDYLGELAEYIKERNRLFKINRWKFYQYMTYDDPVKDAIFQIDDERFQDIKMRVSKILRNTGIELSFKDNKQMIDSMLNMTHYGCAEHIFLQDGKKMVCRSNPVWKYTSMEELAEDIHIPLEKLQQYHRYGND